MDIIQALTQELQVEKWQIEAAVKLIDEGNTIPFISRYRKEATGSLNDEILRNLHERLLYLRNLEDKKKQVLSSIEEQGKRSGGHGCGTESVPTLRRQSHPLFLLLPGAGIWLLIVVHNDNPPVLESIVL